MSVQLDVSNIVWIDRQAGRPPMGRRRADLRCPLTHGPEDVYCQAASEWVSIRIYICNKSPTDIHVPFGRLGSSAKYSAGTEPTKGSRRLFSLLHGTELMEHKRRSIWHGVVWCSKVYT